jgi:hypothetical protein
MQSGTHEQNLQEVIPLLRASGVEPILIKGWSVARLYPEPAVRAYGDLDLCVQPDHLSRAMTALAGEEVRRYSVELHQGVPDLKDHTWKDIVRRTRLVQLGNVDVRVLCPEDQFRLLCLHQMRHGACAPLWLCDLAVALEERPAQFDWDLCLHGHRAWSAWVLCFAHLVGRLLGARLDGPAAVFPVDVPGWLAPTVLARWARPLEERRVLDPIRSAYRRRLSPGLSRPVTQFLGLLGRVAEVPSRIWRRYRRWQCPPNLPFVLHTEAGK